MAAKNQKVQVEVLFAGAEIGGIKLQPHLLKTRRLVTVDMVCPRSAIAKKTVAKEVKFQKAKADLKGQGWTERIMFREDVEGHFGLDGIQERLNRLGGVLDIKSSPGKGTYVRLSISPPHPLAFPSP